MSAPMREKPITEKQLNAILSMSRALGRGDQHTRESLSTWSSYRASQQIKIYGAALDAKKRQAAQRATPPDPATAQHMQHLRERYRVLSQDFHRAGLDTSSYKARLSEERDTQRIAAELSRMRGDLIRNGVLPTEVKNDPELYMLTREMTFEAAEDEADVRAFTNYENENPSTPVPPRVPPAYQGGGSDVQENTFYLVGGVPVQVVRSKNGFLYARTRPRVRGGGQWEYWPGGINQVRREGVRATVEDIAKFGLASGQCFVCGRALADPVSVARGIGPKCMKKLVR